MSCSADLPDTHDVIKYTEEFLRSFQSIKSEVPECVAKSDLYIYAPKPTVHHPKVRSGQKEGGQRNKSYLTASERQDLQRRRKEGEKKRQDDLACNSPVPGKEREPYLTPQKRVAAVAGAKSASGSDIEPNSTDVDDTEAALLDAQEQQLLLTIPEHDEPSSANKPEPRSLLPRNNQPSQSSDSETDERRLSQRLKQLQYGYVTHGYKCYLHVCPKNKRTKKDPQTPNAAQKCSKRSWDGQLRVWRKLLHKYDAALPISETGGTSGNDVSDSEGACKPRALKPTPNRAAPSKHPGKPPTISPEEREALARKRKELGEARATPQKPPPEPPAEEA